jgi:hypothetical protein
MPAAAEHGIAGHPDQRNDAQRRMQRINRTFRSMTAKRIKIDELKNSPASSRRGAHFGPRWTADRRRACARKSRQAAR